MKLFKVVLVNLSLFSVLAASTAVANESAETQGEGPSHHGTNFFPKPQPNHEKSDRSAMVELMEPKAFAKISGGQTTLKWKEVAGADTYRIQVATDPNFKWLVKQEDFYKDTSLQITGLEAGKHYFWRVYAWRTGNDRESLSSFSKFSSFEAL